MKGHPTKLIRRVFIKTLRTPISPSVQAQSPSLSRRETFDRSAVRTSYIGVCDAVQLVVSFSWMAVVSFRVCSELNIFVPSLSIVLWVWSSIVDVDVQHTHPYICMSLCAGGGACVANTRSHIEQKKQTNGRFNRLYFISPPCTWSAHTTNRGEHINFVNTQYRIGGSVSVVSIGHAHRQTNTTHTDGHAYTRASRLSFVVSSVRSGCQCVLIYCTRSQVESLCVRFVKIVVCFVPPN